MQTLELRNRKNKKIVGDLEKPEGEIKGTCIVQHGWGSNRKKVTVQAIKNAFLESGFQTFVFDTTNSYGKATEISRNPLSLRSMKIWKT